MYKNRKTKSGFTLVEIMIVVAIIALLAAIAVPNFLRARKRSQATVVLEELRTIQGAIDQYSMESPTGAALAMTTSGWIGLLPYIKPGTRLYGAFYATGVKDMFNNNYGGITDTDGAWRVGVPGNTFNALSDVAPAAFWSPFN